MGFSSCTRTTVPLVKRGDILLSVCWSDVEAKNMKPQQSDLHWPLLNIATSNLVIGIEGTQRVQMMRYIRVESHGVEEQKAESDPKEDKKSTKSR